MTARAVPDGEVVRCLFNPYIPDAGCRTFGGVAMGRVLRRLGVCLAVLLLGLVGPGMAHAASDHGSRAGAVGGPASDPGGDPGQRCRHGDRGRLLGFDRVASRPTAADARAYL